MASVDELRAQARAAQERLRKSIKVTTHDGESRFAQSVPLIPGLRRAGLQGATAGFSDEIAGYPGAAIAKLMGDTKPYGDIRRDILQSERQQLAQFSNERPVLSTATEIAGGVPGAFLGGGLLGRGVQVASKLPGVGRAVEAAGYIPGIVKAAGTGAAGGGVYAAGKAEQDRTDAALSGALIGAVSGPIAHVVLKGLGAGKARLLTRKAQATPEKARQLVRNALKDSGYTQQEAQRILDDMGPDAVLADLHGQLGNLARTAQSSPSGTARKTAEDFLTARDARQHEKLWTLTRNLVGNEGRTANALEQLNNAQRAAAAPLYKSAYAQKIPQTERLKDVLQLDTVKRAYRKGLQLEENETGRKLSEKLTGFPSMRGWDMIQRGLRRESDTLYRSGDKAGAAALLKLRSGILDEVDNVNPDFARARSVWARGESTKDAMELGTKFLRGDEEFLDAAVAGMTESEKQAFTLGATKAIRETIDKVATNRDLSRINLFQSPTAQRRLSLALGEDNANQLLTTAKNLHEMSVTKNSLLNRSPTADIMAGQNVAGLRGAMVEALMGNPATAARQAVRSVLPQPGMTDRTASGLGNLLLTPSLNINQALMRQPYNPAYGLLGGALGNPINEYLRK